MTIHFPYFMIPVVLTVVIAIVAYFWPTSKPTGGYADIGIAVELILVGAAAIIAILVSWLVYFALT